MLRTPWSPTPKTSDQTKQFMEMVSAVSKIKSKQLRSICAPFACLTSFFVQFAVIR
jgi:hypothetical protein